MTIGVDFDGTCVMDRFPYVGETLPGACRVLTRLVDCGHKIVLWTVRGDKLNGELTPYLQDAVAWFKRNGIPLYGVNATPIDERVSLSPKIHVDLFIDDRNLGCPLKDYGAVDWDAVELWLEEQGVIFDGFQ